MMPLWKTMEIGLSLSIVFNHEIDQNLLTKAIIKIPHNKSIITMSLVNPKYQKNNL